MITAVQKWGNSLALRIPKAYAKEACIEDGSPVELTLEKGMLVITPVRKKVWRLDDLLNSVTPQNRHDAVDTGGAVGQEAW